jgi:hypothetical protein
MRLRNILILVLLAGAATVTAACSTVNALHREVFQPAAAKQDSDPITGEWDVTFFVHESKTPASFTFKLEGTKVTGSAYSDHTGAGTIRDGKWQDGKLSFTLDFKKHESIVVNGAMKDGKLAGEFSTEGFTDKWEAKKK